MLKNMKLGRKLMLGFGLILVIAITLGGMAIVKMRAVQTQSTALVEQAVPMVKYANNVERQSLATMFAVRGYSLTENEKYLEAGRKSLKELAESIQACADLAVQYNLEELAVNASQCKTASELYTDMMEQGVAKIAILNGQRDDMYASAIDYMDTCADFLTTHYAALKSLVDQGADPALINKESNKIRLVNEIVKLGDSARIASFKSQALRDPQVIKDANDYFSQMADKFASLRAISTTDEELLAVDTTEQAGNVYKDAMNGLLVTWLELQDLSAERDKIGDEVLEISRKTAMSGIDQTNSVADGASKSLASASVVMLVGLVIALGLGITITVVLTRLITKPLLTIRDRVMDIAQGEGDLTKRIDIDTTDEIGEVATWFNKFLDNLHTIISDVSGVTREVSSAATEIAASSEEIAAGMERQQQQTSQVSAAVEEMSASVTEVAQKAADASTKAAGAGEQAATGGEVVIRTVEGMRAISEQVNESAVAVGELGRRGEEIGEIISVINDIADQTNLLALNAAIEAARAGEHGRGFAVVADEVRKLAERTTTATEEVAESIKAIQGETTKAVDRMTSGQERVQEGVQLAEQAGQALDAIVSESQSLAGMIQSIAAASEEQSAASTEVSQNVEAINAITNESTEGVRQAAQAAAQLSAKSEQLQEIVGRFKLD